MKRNITSVHTGISGRIKSSIKKLMKIEGKFIYGTRGKPSNGPRGNKKF